MTIAEMKKIIEKTKKYFVAFNDAAEEARRYYRNQTDITFKDPDEGNKKGPLRNADNRTPNNFHRILVDQKTSYALTTPPQFDLQHKDHDKVEQVSIMSRIKNKFAKTPQVGQDFEVNAQVENVLGDRFQKTVKRLGTQASNYGVGCLHFWIDGQNTFKYVTIDPTQIIRIYSETLDDELIAIIRTYDKDGYVYYEYWDDKQQYIFRVLDSTDKWERLEDEEMHHEWGRVPFILFYNNDEKLRDLDSYKGHIDIYDKVYNGFVNDVEDIQQIIMILKGYGGEDPAELNEQLRRFKAIPLDDASGEIKALEVKIPVEARKILLEQCEIRLYKDGMGLDPFDERIGNASSGEAIKFKYAMLDMKANQMVSEFKLSLTEFIRCVLIYLGHNPEDYPIIEQTWTKTAIKNDFERAQIISHLATETSKENIAKNNPLVDDWQRELEIQLEEQLGDMQMEDMYIDQEAMDEPTEGELENVEDEQ